MNEWTLMSLADVITLQRGHDLPATQRGDGTVPVIGSFGITGTHDFARYTGPGVAIGRSGASIGVATYCPSDYWPLNTCLFVKDFRGNDARWVYYLLYSIDFSGFNSGSAQPSLNRNYLANIPVLVPPIAEQRGIAATLGALDDKIESNRRVVAGALALARSHVDRATAGRSVAKYTSALEVCMGSAFKGGAFSDPGSGRPLLRIRDLKTFESQTWTTEVRRDETVIQPGDIVVGMDAEFRATLWLGRESVLNQRVCSFRGQPGVGRAFVITSIEPELAFQEQAKTGTTVIHLNKADIDSFVVPDLTALEHHKLALETEPLIDFAVARAIESGVLAATRDTLLPELLSGRIRVLEAREAVVEAVVEAVG